MNRQNSFSSLVCVTLLPVCAGAQLATADVWEDADRDTRRIDVAEFSELPTLFAAQLTQRGCQVPQTYASDAPHNVIQGEFARHGQMDWAVLCSRGGSSSIIVFWGGEAHCSSELRATQDRHWLQNMGQGIGYSRAITTVGADSILDHHRYYGGPAPPSDLHDGIDEAFIEKGSSVYYCNEGQWLELTGTD